MQHFSALIAALALSALSCTTNCQAQSAPALSPPGDLPQSVRAALAAARIPTSGFAMVLQEVGAAEFKVQHNAQAVMNPASLMKLVTTQAAFDLLGPTFTWRTGVYSTGPVNNGVLDGDLILKGSGDPKLVVENLWLLLRKLQAAGVREIRGDLILDRSAFDIAELETGKFDGEADRAYNVGADALLLNYKSVSYSFIPNGTAAGVSMEPRLAGARLPVMLRSAMGDCGDWRTKLGADFTDPLAPKFSGALPTSCGEQSWHRGVLTPQRYAQALLTQLLSDSGTKLNGKIRDGLLPTAGARLLFDWRSPALAEVVRDINKFSNNVMARQLFLTLASESTQQNATTRLAERTVKEWAHARGLALPELVMENGSGLSRIERISSSGLARVLQHAYAQASMPEFLSSLPIAGLDGTMRRRKGHVAAGSAHIKTGSLNEVSALAGYVLAGSGKRYVLVAICNHENSGAARGALDAALAHAYQLP